LNRLTFGTYSLFAIGAMSAASVKQQKWYGTAANGSSACAEADKEALKDHCRSASRTTTWDCVVRNIEKKTGKNRQMIYRMLFGNERGYGCRRDAKSDTINQNLMY
jgi:hypothetical protein